MIRKYYLLSVCVTLLGFGCKDKPKAPKPTIIPAPQEVTMHSGVLDLSSGFSIEVKDDDLEALKPIIAGDYYMLFKKELNASSATLVLDIDDSLDKEDYTLNVNDAIEIKGGSYDAVALGLSSFWQAINSNLVLPKMTISDHPAYSYRSVMLDVARAWHSPETIKKIIDLCRWYKINYLHLHLTDNSAFTFPSDAYPELATKNHSYTKIQLVALNQYAYERGVVLVPEIDVPGHSSQFIKKMPELFGITKVENNSYTINMGKEEAYKALEVLMKEVASVFTYSPFIHIGGDEAFLEGMEDDPDIVAYMAKYKLSDMHELFLHFLVRMNEYVKQNDKQTIVWAGFGEKGDIKIPKDVIVLLWEHTYHDPKDLLLKKYPIINASFKPLYVVNNRKWEPQYIYNQWQPNRWESWTNDSDFIGEELETNEQVIGATLCAWEQNQINQMPRLRHRVASMSQHLWSKPVLSWETFHQQQQKADSTLQALTLPFTISLKGLTYPELGEGNFYEHVWFGKELFIEVQSLFSDLNLQYATTRDPIAEDWYTLPFPLVLKDNKTVHIRAVNAIGEQVGRTYMNSFYHKPLQIITKGEWKNLPIGSWEKHRFEDTLWVSLSAALRNHMIRYQTDGRSVNKGSKVYKAPIPITKTTHFKAQLFDSNDSMVGAPIGESYYKIWNESSLTTGKTITASNDYIRPNCAAPANNGRITLWEMWGDHVSEENWVMVDLEQIETINRFKVYTFWDNGRYYQYTIEGSLDDKTWFTLVDYSKNKEMATERGIEHKIKPAKTRYVRINMLYNSANPGLHLVEFGAFSD